MPDQPPAPTADRRRRRWKAAASVVLLALAAALIGVREVHPFLARSAPVDAATLVVEGWLPDYALEAAALEFRRGHYRLLVTTGGPLERGSFLSEYRTYAELARATLLRVGLASNEVVAIPAPARARNRTFVSAVALRDHATATAQPLRSINLVSLGTHSRRSHWCFQQALGPEVQVGIIALPSDEYPADAWWKYSAGVKYVLSELLGLLYAWTHLDHGT